jgi:hypothetical protein
MDLIAMDPVGDIGLGFGGEYWPKSVSQRHGLGNKYLD